MTRRRFGAVTARPGVPGRPAARRWPGLGGSRVRGKRAAIPCAAWLESEPNSVPLCSRDSGTPGNQRALRTFCVWASCSCSRQWSEVCGCRLPTRSSGVCSRPRQPWPTALRPGAAASTPRLWPKTGFWHQFLPLPQPICYREGLRSYQHRSIPGTCLATHPSENSSVTLNANPACKLKYAIKINH